MFLCLNCISLPSLCEEQVGEGGRAGREARCVMSSKCWGLVVLSRTWMCKQKWNCIDASKSTFSLAFMDPQPVFWCTCIQTSVHGITIILTAAWWKRWLRWSRNKHAIECWRHWRQIRGWPKEDISWIMIYTTMYIYMWQGPLGSISFLCIQACNAIVFLLLWSFNLFISFVSTRVD